MGLLLRVVGFAAATGLAVWLGALTLVSAADSSLVAPVSGVVFLWAASTSRRSALPDAVVGVATLLVSLVLTGEELGEAAFDTLLVLLEVGLAIWVLHLLGDGLWGGGRGHRAMNRVRDLGVFLLATSLGSLAATVVDQAGFGLEERGTLVALVTDWIRDVSWMTALGSLGLLVGPALTSSARHHLGRYLRYADRRHPVAETLVIAVVTALVYVGIFAQDRPLPITFVLSLPTLWAALRVPPVVATLHAIGSGTAALVLTAAGHGVFVTLGTHLGVILPQAFLATVVVTALALALVTAERELAVERAHASENAAAERASMLTAVMESMAEGIVVVRDDDTVIVRNPASRRLLGLEGETLRGRVQSAARYGGVAADGSPLPDDQMPTALYFSGHDVTAKDYVIRTPDHPEGRTLEISVTELPSDTEHRQAIVNLRDVTQERLDRDNLASFAGVVAHDLNNPLAVVTGWSESLAEAFLEGPVDPEDGTPMLRRIQGAAAHMRQFIDDLLSFTIARDHPLRLTDTDLSAIAEGIATMRREGDTRPRIEVQPRLHVRADTAMVRQLLDNLIGNAAKYVGPGVRPRIEVLGEDGGTSGGTRWLRVTVRDNGIGVPPEQRERIFENFQRAHTGEYAGTGIGLAICRRVVERHGGTIRVEDNPEGQGSQFVFTLPAAA